MVRIKRGRDLTSSASGAPPLGPGASRGRRARKKDLLVKSLVSTEQRSVLLAERLAAVLLSGAVALSEHSLGLCCSQMQCINSFSEVACWITFFFGAAASSGPSLELSWENHPSGLLVF